MAFAHYDDVQALVRHAFHKLKSATYLLLRIADREPARRWLDGLSITSAAVPHADRGLQLAFTNDGLRALGVPAAVLQGFAAEFRSGMAEPNRSRRLGDVEANAPTDWRWGGTATPPPHVLLMLFAHPADLPAWQQGIVAAAVTHGLELVAALATAEQDDYEPFGFRDGISQPQVDWDGTVQRTSDLAPAYPNLIALGEFLLGHRNEYGQFTDRPLVADPDADLPDADDPRRPGAKDLGCNGTYLVVRQLAQDVRGFWRFLDQAAGGDAARRRRLAELMVGRQMDGAPLPGLAADFTYAADPDGRAAPLAAHIRRANPRNGDLPDGTRGWFGRLAASLGFGKQGLRGDLIAASRFHRILRRGRDYGPPLVGPGTSIDAALAPSTAAEAERGLLFVALNASLSRQFEFVQGSWLASGRFDGLEGESDPLLGGRDRGTVLTAGADFRYQERDGARTRLRNLPRFVQVRGGAYFFLPGLRAARHLLRARWNAQ